MMSTNEYTNKYIFIYNLMQAEFYFGKGITPMKVGKGTKGDIFVQFLKTDELKSAFTEWCNRYRPIA